MRAENTEEGHEPPRKEPDVQETVDCSTGLLRQPPLGTALLLCASSVIMCCLTTGSKATANHQQAETSKSMS